MTHNNPKCVSCASRNTKNLGYMTTFIGGRLACPTKSVMTRPTGYPQATTNATTNNVAASLSLPFTLLFPVSLLPASRQPPTPGWPPAVSRMSAGGQLAVGGCQLAVSQMSACACLRDASRACGYTPACTLTRVLACTHAHPHTGTLACLGACASAGTHTPGRTCMRRRTRPGAIAHFVAGCQGPFVTSFCDIRHFPGRRKSARLGTAGRSAARRQR